MNVSCIKHCRGASSLCFFTTCTLLDFDISAKCLNNSSAEAAVILSGFVAIFKFHSILQLYFTSVTIPLEYGTAVSTEPDVGSEVMATWT